MVRLSERRVHWRLGDNREMSTGVRPTDRDELFDTTDVELIVHCDHCDSNFPYLLPLMSDWRDRQRMESLRASFPVAACPSCGEDAAVPGPVVVLRPGDPIPVVFCVSAADSETMARLEDALATQINDAGVVAGPVANTSPELVGVVADRYSGFQLAGVDAAGQEWADDPRVLEWVAAMRWNHPWPDVVAAVGRLVASDDADAEGVIESEPELTQMSWEPVVRRIGVLTAASQVDPVAADVVRARMSRPAQSSLRALGFDAETDSAKEALALLRELTALGSAASRSPADLRAAIASGRELIALATREFGDAHPMTLTAMNDTAARLLDDMTAGDAFIDARSMLDHVRRTAARLELPIVVDATVNFALSELRPDRVADADAAEAAMSLLHDAVHLCQLYFPDEPSRGISAIVNQAALSRSRLAGNPSLNVAKALELFDYARCLDVSDPLPQADAIMLEGNLVSALADRARLDLSPEHDDAVIHAVDALRPKLDQLESTHPVRTRALVNLGAIVLEMLHRVTSNVGATQCADAEEWLEDAVDSTRHLAADDATRVLAATTLAGVLFWRGEDTDLDRAEELLCKCAAALEDSAPTRLHHLVCGNLAQMHLSRGNWDAAVEVLRSACDYADDVIDRAPTLAARLGHVAAASDLYHRLALLYAHRLDARSVIHTIERSRARWRRTTVGDYDSTEVDEAVQRWLRAGTAMLYVGTCSLGSYAVVLVPGKGAGAWTALVKSRDVASVLAALDTAQSRADVEVALDRAWDVLGDGLLNQAARILRDAAVDSVAIVACGALSGLPLAALGGSAGMVEVAASAQYIVAATAVPRRNVDPDRTLAIVNPTGDLRFAADELVAVERFAGRVVTPPQGAGLRGWLLEQLPTATHLHLACHARYDPGDPFASRFILGDKTRVTVEDLAMASMPHLAMVVASCCSTGVVDQAGADELIGLAHTMIAAGAGSVVATLWDVEDAGTCLLMSRFYDRLVAGLKAPDALADAQRTLREYSAADFLDLAAANDLDSWIPPRLRQELRVLLLDPEFRDTGRRPFAHAANWSSVVYIAG